MQSDQQTPIVDRATPPSLKKVTMEIIMVLLDDSLAVLDGHEQINRALNLIALRLCSATDATSFLVAVTENMIASLEDPAKHKYVELLSKVC